MRSVWAARAESTIIEAADRAGVDHSTVMKLRQLAKAATAIPLDVSLPAVLARGGERRPRGLRPLPSFAIRSRPTPVHRKSHRGGTTSALTVRLRLRAYPPEATRASDASRLRAAHLAL